MTTKAERREAKARKTRQMRSHSKGFALLVLNAVSNRTVQRTKKGG